MFSNLWSDVRLALRAAWRQPLFTTVVVGTLALGIGANTAIFGVVEALLLRPLPFPEQHRLVSVLTPLTGLGVPNAGLSLPELQDLRDRAGVFDAITPVWPFDTNLTGGERPERVAALAVSPNYFTLLGARPALGRLFGRQDEVKGFAEAVVLSDAAWRARFGGDPHIIGRKLRFDNDMYTVVGVLPPGFRHPGIAQLGDVEAWVTAGFAAAPFPDPPTRAARQLPRTIARLAPGMTLGHAQAKLTAFADALRRGNPNAYPERLGWTVALTLLTEELTGNVRPVLLIILGAVGCVLLVCCVSIANMILARASGRRHEFAIRRALGASRGTIVRQVLVECVVLSVIGGAASLLLVLWLQQVLVMLAPANLPRLSEVGLNATVLGFMAVLSLAAGLLVGLAPAVQVVRADVVGHLRSDSKGGASPGNRGRTRVALVVAEVALSMTLLVGAGLLYRSFSKVIAVDGGFNPHGLTVASVWLPAPNDPARSPYPDQQSRNAMIRSVISRLRTLPGVQMAAMGGGQSIPLLGFNPATFRIEGKSDQADQTPTAQVAGVTPDYFKALGIRLVDGRLFDETDDGQNRVIVVDETMARRYWKGESAVGKRIAFGQQGQPRWAEIVGVVGRIKTESFEAADAPHVFVCMYQGAGNAMSVFVRTAPGKTILPDTLRREVEVVDPNLPVFGTRPMDEVVDRSLARRRFALTLMAAFAVVALVLAGLGIYGVTAFSVAQRTREIGLRIAIGAGGREIIAMILREGLVMTAIGVAAGLAGAVALTRFLRTLLYAVEPGDPPTHACVALVLASVAIAACCVPAMRAVRIDPASALRSE
jgi:predicted permease